jgi:quercetin dioxygenase-like cupin family protein
MMLFPRLTLGAAVLVALTVVACSDRSGSTITSQSGGSLPAATDSERADRAMVGDDRIVWGPAPPIFPPGAQFAVLEGDPSKAGEIFTIRLRFPNGYILPPHFHPTDEYVTVIRGTFLAGMGATFSKEALVPFKMGDFTTMPKDMAHFASTLGITEVQVHAIGPFALTYVNPADDPTK